MTINFFFIYLQRVEIFLETELSEKKEILAIEKARDTHNSLKVSEQSEFKISWTVSKCIWSLAKAKFNKNGVPKIFIPVYYNHLACREHGENSIIKEKIKIMSTMN